MLDRTNKQNVIKTYLGLWEEPVAIINGTAQRHSSCSLSSCFDSRILDTSPHTGHRTA